jgi:hypothetical protein
MDIGYCSREREKRHYAAQTELRLSLAAGFVVFVVFVALVVSALPLLDDAARDENVALAGNRMSIQCEE